MLSVFLSPHRSVILFLGEPEGLSSSIDLNGAIPVPVAMNSTSFAVSLNVNFPVGPMKFIFSPIFKFLSQLLPRPSFISFIQMSNLLLFFCGAEQIEYALKHG